jgi:hypothetical protein
MLSVKQNHVQLQCELHPAGTLCLFKEEIGSLKYATHWRPKMILLSLRTIQHTLSDFFDFLFACTGDFPVGIGNR